MTDDSAPFPRVLILCIAVTGGVMTAIAAQLALAHVGLDLGAVWRNMLGARTGQLRSAFAWWAIALVSFAAGFVIAWVTKLMAAAQSDLAALRWIGGSVLVVGLALIGHEAAAPSLLGPGANAALGIASLTVAGLLSLLGAYFVTRH
jgi:hypothetical protein